MRRRHLHLLSHSRVRLPSRHNRHNLDFLLLCMRTCTLWIVRLLLFLLTLPFSPADDPALGISGLPRPTCLEQLAHFEAREGMRFRVEDDICQREDVGVGEEEVEVFEGFGLADRSVS